MDQEKSSLFTYTELSSLRRIDAEFWKSLDKNLQQDNYYQKVNLRPLIKLQKSMNNTMMKLISQSSDGLAKGVDEVEGFVRVPMPELPATL